MDEKLPKTELSENEQALLGILYSVELTPKNPDTNEHIIGGNKTIKLNEDGIKSVSEKRLQDQIDKIPSLLKSLLKMGYINKNESLHELTVKGREIGKTVRSRWSSELYSDLLLRCANSQAYAQFCERAHGKNLLQFNVVDMEHLELLMNKLKINANDVVLDLGCGLGKITEYIAQKTNSKITGIDSSQKAIEWAQKNTKINEKLSFDVVDINDLDYPSESFDVILALDVLYWIENLEPVVKKLKDILKPNGRMGLFYVLFRTKEEPIESVLVDSSKIGKLLKKNNFKYEIIDISQNAVHIWKQKISVGTELRPIFEAEGNLDIIDSRMKSGENVINNFQNDLQKRYFIYIENKQ
ncbi:MAG: class I SAM-dependent methyltransferase [Asgard group archaeon]|nr:class I SAM-dependent methyltransferase [Asgard group archaeon]